MSEFFFPEVMLLKSDTIADSGTLPLTAAITPRDYGARKDGKV